LNRFCHLRRSGNIVCCGGILGAELSVEGEAKVQKNGQKYARRAN
jgi:hypothetical protein